MTELNDARTEFLAAKEDPNFDPVEYDKLAQKVVELRAAERAGRTGVVGGDAVPQIGG